MRSPSALSREELKARGFIVDSVEQFLYYAKVRKDLFGIVDLFAVGDFALGIQATTHTNHNARVRKALKNTALPVWLKCGLKFGVWAWKSYKVKCKTFHHLRETYFLLNEDGTIRLEGDNDDKRTRKRLDVLEGCGPKPKEGNIRAGLQDQAVGV